MKRVAAPLIASLLLGFLFLSKLPPPVLCRGDDGRVAVHFENPAAERCDTGHCGTDPRAARASHPPLVRPSQCLETSGFHHEPAVQAGDLTLAPERDGSSGPRSAQAMSPAADDLTILPSRLDERKAPDRPPLEPPPKDAFQRSQVLRR